MSTDSSAPVAVQPVVILEYADVMGAPTAEMRKKIEEAYGYDGLGILAIRGVPDFAAARAACLPMAYKFGALPESVKAKYVHEPSTYSFGWSHGKEKLEGKPDFAKGSYYFNPMSDRPVDDEETIKAHAPFAHPNIWPAPEDCPGFEAANKACSQVIVRVGLELARHCDDYVVATDPTFKGHELARIIKDARCHKGRLLIYFPYPGATDAKPATESKEEAVRASEAETSSWCGWHNDHGSLTGLCPAMFFDKDGVEIPCPDPKAGLYIRTRHGKTVRVSVPSDCIAYQIGETAQVHTGGILQATPHCVQAAAVPGVSRGTLAVFMEPEWDELMGTPSGADTDRILRGARGELMPKGVPPLVDRWLGNDQSFGAFTDRTLSMYY